MKSSQAIVLGATIFGSLSAPLNAAPAPATQPAAMSRLSPATLKLCRELMGFAAKEAAAPAEPDVASRESLLLARSEVQTGDLDYAIPLMQKAKGGINFTAEWMGHALSHDCVALEGLAGRLPDIDALNELLAKSEAHAGRFGEALQAFQKVKDPMRRTEAAHSIAAWAGRAGKKKIVSDMLPIIEAGLTDKSGAIEYDQVAGLQAMAGSIDAARKTIKDHPDQSTFGARSTESRLAAIPLAVAVSGDFTAAEKMLDDVSQPDREFVQVQMVRELAEAGKFDEARALLMKTLDPDSKVEGLHDIAFFEARQGKTDDAKSIVANLAKYPEGHVDQLRAAIVEALVKRGELADAEQTARAISRAPIRAHEGLQVRIDAYCMIARAKALRNDPTAKDNLAEAIAQAKIEEKAVRDDASALVMYDARILWAAAPDHNVDAMKQLCESLSKTPAQRCEAYVNTISLLIDPDAF